MNPRSPSTRSPEEVAGRQMAACGLGDVSWEGRMGRCQEGTVDGTRGGLSHNQMIPGEKGYSTGGREGAGAKGDPEHPPSPC